MSAAARRVTLLAAVLGLTSTALPAASSTSHAAPGPDQGRVSVHQVTGFSSPRSSSPQFSDEATVGSLTARAEQGRRRYVTAATPLPGRAGILGVTWAKGDATVVPHVQVRTQVDGRWSRWTDVDATDPRDRPGGRPGTEAIMFGDADQRAEVRVEAVAGSPRLWVVDSATDDADRKLLRQLPAGGPSAGGGAGSLPVPEGGQRAFGLAATTSGYPVGGPIIATRAQWGADESISTWSPRRQYDPSGVTIHHTAGVNGQTADQIPATLRAIHHYHAEVRGWGDIGYNVLVDPFGRAWEGRKGGVNEFIQGAHAAGVNSRTTGVSLMGDFTSVMPSEAQRGAAASVAGWALSANGIAPHSQFTEYNQYLTGGGGAYDAVIGHREVAWTACPGDTFWSAFAPFKAEVAAFAQRDQTAVQRVDAVQAETSATVSAHLRHAFPVPSAATEVVYMSHWVDRAGSADAALRAIHGGHPSMLASLHSVPEATVQELRRLGTKQVVLTSPETEVSSRAVAQLEAMGITVTRQAADTVPERSVETSRQWSADQLSTVYLANSESGYADLISGGAAAAHEGAPLLMTGAGQVSPVVLERLREIQPSTVKIVGGVWPVTPAMEQQVRQAVPGASIVRIAGASKVDTSAELARQVWGAGGSNGVVAVSGEDYNPAVPTALHVAAVQDDPIVYTGQSCQSDAVRRASQEIGSSLTTLAGLETRTDWSAGTTSCS